ncbi:hypothetical protein MMB17_18640 [Methylobacterium organophilum]|uniref:hypothetical protein n=1 Tax=Methylobacterium organophilum TaxID=410 RepID=UPI001F12EB41|nr:hypothetical protein [Methylobacterium organophilum]UMY16681.1 hypothetical protein MMB17_18640 [Methylobacterium organophilum]
MNIYADNRPETIRSIIIWASAVFFTGYQILNVFVPNGEMILYVRILDVAATAVALWIFAPDAWGGFLRRTPIPRDFLIVGIWLKFLSSELQGIYAILYRLGGAPQWFLNNELLPWVIMIGIVAVVLHVCTPGALDERDGRPAVPRRNQYALAIGFGCAVLMVGALVASKPDVQPWLERTRPYIGDWWKTSFLSPAGAPPT